MFNNNKQCLTFICKLLLDLLEFIGIPILFHPILNFVMATKHFTILLKPYKNFLKMCIFYKIELLDIGGVLFLLRPA